MTPSTLRAALLDAGLNVREWSGWERNGGRWASGKPVALMHHHTAPPVPFPVGWLAGEDRGRVKCNINTKPDGTVWLVAYEACNYSSGMGSGKVLDEVRQGIVPRLNARTRGLTDTTNGNPHFLNFENDHKGDGSALPQVQFEAIVTATRVVLDHFSLPDTAVISHAEWTARKHDPYWNGSLRAIEKIRAQLEEEPEMKPPAWAIPATQWHIDKGIYTQSSPDDVDESNEFHRQTVFRHRFYEAIKGEVGSDGVSEAKVKELIASAQLQVP